MSVFVHFKWSYVVNSWNKVLSVRSVKMKSICWVLWINQLLKNVFLSLYELKANNLKPLSHFPPVITASLMLQTKNITSICTSITDKNGFVQRTLPPCAYKLECLNVEIERNTFKKTHFTEADYRFTIKLNFSTKGSIIEISRKQPLFSFIPDYSIRDLSGFSAVTIYEKFSLSPDPVEISTFDNLFL